MMNQHAGMKSIGRMALLLLLVTAVAACSSSKKRDLKPVELERFKAEIKLDHQWSRTIGKGLRKYYHQFALAVDGGYIYTASADGKLFQLDKYNGKVRWKASLDMQLTTGVTVDRQHVYVAGSDGVLIALKKLTGEQVWTAQVDSEIVSPPVSNSDGIFFQTASGEMYGINVADGSQRWREPSTMPALTLRGNSRPVLFDDYVIFGQASGRLAMMNAQTGAMRWDPRVANPKGDSEIERIVDIDSTPVIQEERLYAVSYQGQLAGFNMSSGQTFWSVDESSYRDLSMGLGNIYVSASNAQVNAYDQRTGDVKWSQEGLLRRRITSPAVISSYLVVADFEGYIHLLSQIDGRFIARTRLNSKGVKTGILVDGDRFYVIANNGRLKAYQLGKSLK